ncbi:MAG: FAD-dependent oxidoreductase [Azospirillaceae bacterium]
MSAAAVVVGAGEAGARAVAELREAGHDGPITLVGEEGRAPYERPPLSKEALTGEDEPAPRTIRDADGLAADGVTFLSGVRATGIDREARRVTLSDGQTIGYDALLLATGARARPLPCPGGENARLLRSFDDAAALRKRLASGARVVLVGGGFIGLELAASAAARGARVTVLEAAPRILGRIVPEEIAAIVAGRHAEAGVEIRCGVTIERIEGGEAGCRVVLADGPALEADTVIAGIGAVPNTELAEAAGLAIDNGVAVDGAMRSSDPAIFAAGDCASFPHPLYDGRRIRLEAWRGAQDAAETAARAMAGQAVEHEAVPWFWSDQVDMTMQIAGLPDAGAATVVREREDGVAIRFRVAGDGRVLAASAIGPGNAVAKDIRLAEMMIARRAAPARERLADPSVGLKKLLAG